jgi:putative DNA methylase
MIVVFANKSANAWEILVSGIIRAGFVVDASWPIQTEMGTRTRVLTSAVLASSVWAGMPENGLRRRGPGGIIAYSTRCVRISTRAFENTGAPAIRGPDFVWAATGPLEAYSKHPVVKKANEPGAVMEVSEFLRAARRIVVDFVVAVCSATRARLQQQGASMT